MNLMNKQIQKCVDILQSQVKNLQNVNNFLYNLELSDESKDLYESVLSMMELYISKQQNEIINITNALERYNQVHYTEPEMDAMCIHSEYHELNLKYERLKKDHEDLQDLFVQVDFELDQIKYAKSLEESDPDYWDVQYEVNRIVSRDKYEALQKDYHLVVKELNRCVNDCLDLARQIDEQ